MPTVYDPNKTDSSETITFPADGDAVTAASVTAALTQIAARLERLASLTSSTLVTSTNSWDVTGANNVVGLTVTATGTATGAVVTGGSSGGTGLIAQSHSGSNSRGFSAIGYGNAAGMRATPGASNDSAIEIVGALEVHSSTGSAQKNPAATTAVTNTIYAKSMIKAWGFVVDGVLVDGFNIASVAVNGTDNYVLDVVMATAMSSANYAIICTGASGFGSNTFRSVSPRRFDHSSTPRTATAFFLEHRSLFDAGAVAIADSEFSFFVLGAQS